VYRLRPYGTNVMSGSLSFLSVVIAHFWSHVYMTSGVVLLGSYDLGHQVELIERFHGTFTYVPSPIIPDATRALANAPVALECLQSINVGASAIPAHVLSDFADVVGDRVVGVYGLTEAAGVPLFAGQVHEWRRPDVGFERVGAMVAPSVTRIVDREGREVPWDGTQVGEIIASTPAAMRGYWKNPEATAATLRDGWLYTGDLGSLTPDGYLRIQGRVKDMLISGGINVYPAEIEAVVQADAAIAECAVVGTPDQRWGETPVAFVTLTGPGALADVQSHVTALCRAQLASYKCPSAVHVLDAFPRNANGKILKTELRAMLSAGHSTSRPIT
jgi:fatty-acyl-CoA synthase